MNRERNLYAPQAHNKQGSTLVKIVCPESFLKTVRSANMHWRLGSLFAQKHFLHFLFVQQNRSTLFKTGLY